MIGFFLHIPQVDVVLRDPKRSSEKKFICLSIKTENMKSSEQLINLEATGILHVFHNLANCII